MLYLQVRLDPISAVGRMHFYFEITIQPHLPNRPAALYFYQKIQDIDKIRRGSKHAAVQYIFYNDFKELNIDRSLRMEGSRDALV